MHSSDFNTPAETKLKKIGDLLEQMFGLRIDWDTPTSELQTVLDHYIERREHALSENMVINTNHDYAKSVLITEAIRIYLREIAPAREKKKRRNK